jgi:hypothetical protein
MLIEDGKGTGRKAEVNSENMLVTRSVTESHLSHVADDEGIAYIITVDDVGPVAGEYTLYIKNTNSSDVFVVDCMTLNNVDADVVWKIHQVTGTAAGASVLTPINTNLSSGNTADMTVRGGAGGVTGLTSVNVLNTTFGGSANSNVCIDLRGAIILGHQNAIAVEYDAGTGGAVSITLLGHYHA